VQAGQVPPADPLKERSRILPGQTLNPEQAGDKKRFCILPSGDSIADTLFAPT